MVSEQIQKPVLNGMAPLIQVFDMPRSLKFYRDVLGFSMVSASAEGDDADWVLLRYNEIDLMLNTAYERDKRPDTEDEQRKKNHRDTTLFFGCADIDGAFEYLKERGVRLESPYTTGYGWKAITFNDPDGYSICIHWPQDNEKSS